MQFEYLSTKEKIYYLKDKLENNLKQINNLKNDILLEHSTQENVLVVYFATIKLQEQIKKYTELEKLTLKILIHKNTYEEYYFNELLYSAVIETFNSKIENNKYFIDFLDRDFILKANSGLKRDRISMKMYGIDYKKVLRDLNANINLLTKKLEESSENWYLKNKYQEDKTTILDKEELIVYKIKSVDTSSHTISVDVFAGSYRTDVHIVTSIECKRKSNEFIYNKLSEIYPGMFI
jgi:hypothetical protein